MMELFSRWTEAVYALTMLIPKTMLRATSERAGRVSTFASGVRMTGVAGVRATDRRGEIHGGRPRGKS
ncbi:hypothetical protein CUJ84_Chr000584 [Rhizobium leguminosarum]|uniref:Uncharacterized protein n=1 Tax=Rhizobium leguminosarum TaxID=384 RepID=A0A2K9YYP9_RHILE|nr:hypothetical protein CUJ84_Chr000584 [Rhizobium leguminosarum]